MSHDSVWSAPGVQVASVCDQVNVTHCKRPPRAGVMGRPGSTTASRQVLLVQAMTGVVREKMPVFLTALKASPRTDCSSTRPSVAR